MAYVLWNLVINASSEFAWSLATYSEVPLFSLAGLLHQRDNVAEECMDNTRHLCMVINKAEAHVCNDDHHVASLKPVLDEAHFTRVLLHREMLRRCYSTCLHQFSMEKTCCEDINCAVKDGQRKNKSGGMGLHNIYERAHSAQ
eukprot:3062097-Karenia_brevis.AAC.1